MASPVWCCVVGNRSVNVSRRARNVHVPGCALDDLRASIPGVQTPGQSAQCFSWPYGALVPDVTTHLHF